MKKLFVVLFIKDKVFQYKIDELIQNTVNGFVDSSFATGETNIYLPIQIKGDKYNIVNTSPFYQIKFNGAKVEDIEINGGDYFLFKGEYIKYSALFMDYNNLCLSHKVYHLGKSNIFLGNSSNVNIIIDSNIYVPGRCAVIKTSKDGKKQIENLSDVVGVYVNRKFVKTCDLNDGDEIYIMGVSLFYYSDLLVIPSNIKTKDLEENKFTEKDILPNVSTDSSIFSRGPRIVNWKELSEKIVIDAPPGLQNAKETPFLLMVGPSLTMSIAMFVSLGSTISNAVASNNAASVISSGAMALSMLCGAILWPILLRKYNKKQQQDTNKLIRKKYGEYLVEQENKIVATQKKRLQLLESLMPSPSALSKIIENKKNVWERSISDEDFLNVRIGKGVIPFGDIITVPTKTFSVEENELLDQAINLKDKYMMLKDAPISFSLMENKVCGIVEQSYELLKTIVTNIIALHSPEDVKMVFIYNSSHIVDLKWVNDLPHVWSNNRQERYIATTKEEAKTVFASLDELLFDRINSQQKKEHLPHYIFFVLDDNMISDFTFRNHLINPNNTIGISSIFFGEEYNGIPKECVVTVQKIKNSNSGNLYIKNGIKMEKKAFVVDFIDDKTVKANIENINKIKIKAEKTALSVPNRVSFLDLYKVGNVKGLEILNHWGTNASDKTLAAPIGIKAGSEVFSLDIHEKSHGCHGLIAGSTGSGKSEFIQAYILSMMINYSPNEVNFVLVDFKGGDMARPFLKTPHLSATISNLSENTLHRALISLEAEVKNRQEKLNIAAEELNVDKIDINSYHKYFKEKKLKQPLPHLIIIIDEFAQLKAQHPEFMSKLVDIAQVGRSLGLHLILATQRPSGLVDPQIWSNSRFKISLKVLDKQDSVDMIGRPDAAMIKNPGRAYIRIGYDEIFELVQSGYSGADYVAQNHYIDENSIMINMINYPGEYVRSAKKPMKVVRSSKTQLEEVVAVINEMGKFINYNTKKLWLPPLPSELLLEECVGEPMNFDYKKVDKDLFTPIICGKMDIPESQQQIPFKIDFLKEGHLLVFGSSGVGKSTLIQTIMYSMALKYSPSLFNTYILDCNGGSLGNLKTMPHCKTYLTAENQQEANELFSKLLEIISERRKEFSKNHCANFESYIRLSKNKMPMIMFVIDNYSEFREQLGSYEMDMIKVIAAARSCGIYIVITATSRNIIPMKIAEQVSNMIVLNMNDPRAYGDILDVRGGIIPDYGKGRAVVQRNKKLIEIQLAVPYHTNNETLRINWMEKVYKSMSDVYCVREKKVQEKKKEEVPVVPAQIKKEDSEQVNKAKKLAALILGKDINTKGIKGFDFNESPRIFVGIKENREVINIINKNINKFLSGNTIYVITSNDDIKENEKIKIVPDIDTFISEYCESKEMQEKSVLIIDDFYKLYEKISDEALSKFEKALRNNNDMKILTYDNMTKLAELESTELHIHLIKVNCGVIVGGNLDDNKIFVTNKKLFEIDALVRQRYLSDNQALIYDLNSKITSSITIEGV